MYLHSLFNVVANTGVIRTRGSLDYETKRQHNFTVEVVDGGPSPRTGKAFVIVNVIDREDSVPKFEVPRYSAEFEENKVGELITVKVSSH